MRRLAARRPPGHALLEGPRVVRQAVNSGIPLEVLAVRSGTRFEAPAQRKVEMSERAFKAAAQTESPQGVIAIARVETGPVAAALEAARAAGWPLLVLDGVQDPGNVGAIARTAAAAGAPALVVMPGTADPFGPKAIRASTGHVFNLTLGAGDWSQLEGLRMVAADQHGVPLDQHRLEVDALVLGSEARGVSRALEAVAVPMAAGVESLNVAAAAAIILYEMRRRRAG